MPTSSELIGNWRLRGLIGEGAHGRVHEAEHISVPGKLAALKELHRKLAADPGIKARFLREAQVVSRIRHTNVVDLYDCGIAEDGTCYLVMQLIKGRSLAEELLSGRLSPPRSIEFALQISRGLAAVHHVGVIHRDLKPENIMLTPETGGGDRLVLLDFGVAKLINTSEETDRTRSRSQVGSREHMSPEQWLCLPVIDGRADIYALGTILFEMLTGQRPFRAESDYEWQQAHMHDAVPDPARLVTIPLSLARLVRAMMSKEASERPANMAEVLGELQRCHEQLESTQGISSSPHPHRAKRKLATIGRFSRFLAACTVLVGGLAVARYWPRHDFGRNGLPVSPSTVPPPGPTENMDAAPSLGMAAPDLGQVFLGERPGCAPTVSAAGLLVATQETSRAAYQRFHDQEYANEAYPWAPIEGAAYDRVKERPVTLILSERAQEYCGWCYPTQRGRLPTTTEWQRVAQEEFDHQGRIPWPGASQTPPSSPSPTTEFRPVQQSDDGPAFALIHLFGNAAELALSAGGRLSVCGGSMKRAGHAELSPAACRAHSKDPDPYVGFRCFAEQSR